MAYTVNATFQLQATATGTNMNELSTLTLTSTELIQTSVTVGAGLAVAAGVAVDLTNLSAPVLLVITTTEPILMRINAEEFDHTIKKLFVFDGTEVTALKLGNTGLLDAVVTVIAYG